MTTMTKSVPAPMVPLTDAAAQLGLGYHQARDLVLKRRLQGAKYFGRWMVDAKSLDAFEKEAE